MARRESSAKDPVLSRLRPAAPDGRGPGARMAGGQPRMGMPQPQGRLSLGDVSSVPRQGRPSSATAARGQLASRPPLGRLSVGDVTSSSRPLPRGPLAPLSRAGAIAMEQRRHGKFTTGHVISHGRRPMALGRLSAADSMARDPEAGISRLSVGDVVPRASLQAPRRRRRWSRRVLLAVLGGVALAGILGLGLGLGLSAPGRDGGGDESGLLAPRPPEPPSPPPFSPLQAEVDNEVVLDLSSGVLLNKDRPATAAEIIDEIVKGITDQGQPAPVSITVIQRLDVVAFQPPGTSDDDFAAVLCSQLPADYDRERYWYMTVPLLVKTSGLDASHSVIDPPDFEGAADGTTATLQAVAIEMRTVVEPGSQDSLVEDAVASGDTKAAVARDVLASLLSPNVSDPNSFISNTTSY
ncbi:hypothetical protein EMIHUDRAFT_230754, partial [Emiliania huxleyi CCMP1516]|uniref:TPM domain-containing protein n=2 Tax=Emiliania huxleyi TaxID=2903 RepID=A0A0D3K9Z6_EMIH1